MSKKINANPRILDLTMSDLNWLGRIAYVDDVLNRKDIRKKRWDRTIPFIIVLIFVFGIVSGMLIYHILSTLF